MKGSTVLKFLPGLAGAALLVAAAFVELGVAAGLAVAGVLLLALDRRL